MPISHQIVAIPTDRGLRFWRRGDLVGDTMDFCLAREKSAIMALCFRA